MNYTARGGGDVETSCQTTNDRTDRAVCDWKHRYALKISGTRSYLDTGVQIFQIKNVGGYLKILGARKVAGSKFHANDLTNICRHRARI